MILKASSLDTPLGLMIAISDNESLYLLAFADGRGLAREMKKLASEQNARIISEETAKPIAMIKQELDCYFSGSLKTFKTPLRMIGSDFQKKAWHALMQIPYGQTSSYLAQAKTTGHERAYRAVANANGANPFSIVIPCHRIINSNGNLGGYGGGRARKQWLINHERQYA